MAGAIVPGLDAAWEEQRAREGLAAADLARVVAEHRGRWTLATSDGERDGVLAGALRDAIDVEGAPRPAVGDFVALRPEPPGAPSGPRVIQGVLPRRTCLARRAAGADVREQVVAANVDVAFVVCAAGRDVNVRRIERFAAIAAASGVRTVLVVTKADLVPDAEPILERARAAAPGVDAHAVSALAGTNLEALAPYLAPGATVVLLGTSGAGKTTLVNAWLGRDAFATASVGVAGKGRHTTTARQMIALPGGAFVIDTPGVREVGLWVADEGVAATFADVAGFAASCRFSDCAHQGEPGCAVAEAVRAGALDADRVEAWHRLRREQEHVARQADAAAAERSRRAARSGAKALRARLRDKGRR